MLLKKILLYVMCMTSACFAAAEEVQEVEPKVSVYEQRKRAAAKEYIASLGTLESCIDRMATIIKPNASKSHPLRLLSAEKKTIEPFFRNDFLGIIDILMWKPSPKNRFDEEKTLLHCAASIYPKDSCFYGHALKTEVIKALLILGCDPNALDDSGSTPLHYLIDFEAGSGGTKSIELLLHAGTDLTIINRHKQTALAKLLSKAESFSSSTMIELIKLFFAKGADPWYPSRNDPNAPGNAVHNLRKWLWQETSSPFVMYGAEYMHRRCEADKTYQWFIEECKYR